MRESRFTGGLPHLPVPTFTFPPESCPTSFEGRKLAPPADWGLDRSCQPIPKDFRHLRGVAQATDKRKMPARKILVVDDDDMLRDSLVEQLSLYEEFEVIGAPNAAKGVQRARQEPIDLVVMDVGLPDMDGREAVKLLRKGGFKAPVIMLTAQDSESDTILGLEAGANDYVTKPFRFAVLLARIRAQLRQHDQSEDAVFSIGHYTFRPSAKMLVDERNQKVRLTEKETAILKYLYRAGEKVITRDVLLHEVWGYNSGVTTHTLETHIYRLRQKIERDPSKAELLVTEAGGYKLVP
jgi:DNA-binding response OmpR family regulator